MSLRRFVWCFLSLSISAVGLSSSSLEATVGVVDLSHALEDYLENFSPLKGEKARLETLTKEYEEALLAFEQIAPFSLWESLSCSSRFETELDQTSQRSLALSHEQTKSQERVFQIMKDAIQDFQEASLQAFETVAMNQNLDYIFQKQNCLYSRIKGEFPTDVTALVIDEIYESLKLPRKLK